MLDGLAAPCLSSIVGKSENSMKPHKFAIAVLFYFATATAWAGGQPWYYSFAYEPDVKLALQKLRQREFTAGRYNPVIRFPRFPVSTNSPAPGAKHKSIEQAIEASGADGTRSILDMKGVSDKPKYFAVSLLSKESLMKCFGTAKPTREGVEKPDKLSRLFEMLNERGQGVYFITYKGDQPAEYFFAGYSFD